MKLGTTELIVILVVVLLIFGPSRLPALGKMAGQAVGSLRKQTKSVKQELNEETAAPEKSAPVKTAEAAAFAAQAENSDSETVVSYQH